MGLPIDPNEAPELARKALEAVRNEMRETALREAEMTEDAIDDTLANGGYHEAFADVLDDLVTFPAAILRGRSCASVSTSPGVRTRKPG